MNVPARLAGMAHNGTFICELHSPEQKYKKTGGIVAEVKKKTKTHPTIAYVLIVSLPPSSPAGLEHILGVEHMLLKAMM